MYKNKFLFFILFLLFNLGYLPLSASSYPDYENVTYRLESVIEKKNSSSGASVYSFKTSDGTILKYESDYANKLGIRFSPWLWEEGDRVIFVFNHKTPQEFRFFLLHLPTNTKVPVSLESYDAEKTYITVDKYRVTDSVYGATTKTDPDRLDLLRNAPGAFYKNFIYFNVAWVDLRFLEDWEISDPVLVSINDKFISSSFHPYILWNLRTGVYVHGRYSYPWASTY